MALLSSKLSDTGRVLEPQHIMLFGPPKSGKTTLIGNLAKQGFKLLWLDLEKGISTLLKGDLSKEDLDNIQYVGIKDTRPEPIAHATIDKLIRGGETWQICEEHGRIDCPVCKREKAEFQEVTVPKTWGPQWYDWVLVIDSGTQLSMSITNTLLKGKDVDYQETLHDFRNQGNYLNRIMTYLQQAPFHVIMTAHEIEAEREDSKLRIVPSLGSRNYAITCGKFFDHIVYLDKVNNKHKAYSSTEYSNTILTGSRLGVRIEDMAEASLAELITGQSGGAGQSKVVQAEKTLQGLGTASTVSTTKSMAELLAAKKLGG